MVKSINLKTSDMKEKKKLIVLVNLGSPHELTVKAIRLFLAKFLSDRRVVNLPRVLWYPILYGIILPFRAPKLFKLYRQIWHKSGVSPLIHYTQVQAEILAARIKNNDVIVTYAFCYANPEISNVLLDMHAKYEITDLKIIPLYPQFSSTTTLPVFDQVTVFYQDKYYLPNLYLNRSFHDHDKYINLLAQKIKSSWNTNGRADKLVLSFHSLPIAVIQNGDCYYEECLHTSELVAGKLDLRESDYSVTFQSKFGRQKWLTPATNLELIALAKSSLSVDIICPGFVSDCLETLEEINVTNRELYLKNGGKSYNYIACFNDDDEFISVLEFMVKDNICVE